MIVNLMTCVNLMTSIFDITYLPVLLSFLLLVLIIFMSEKFKSAILYFFVSIIGIIHSIIVMMNVETLETMALYIIAVFVLSIYYTIVGLVNL